MSQTEHISVGLMPIETIWHLTTEIHLKVTNFSENAVYSSTVPPRNFHCCLSQHFERVHLPQHLLYRSSSRLTQRGKFC